MTSRSSRGHAGSARAAASFAAVIAALGLWTATPARASLVDDLPAGTGYAAWELCTRAVHGGDDFQRVRDLYTAPKVQPLPLFWDIDHVHGSRVQVQTWLPFLNNRRTAVHRPGLGCTLVTPDSSEAKVRSQAVTPIEPPSASSEPWPLGEAAPEADALSGEQLQAVRRHAQAMFANATEAANRRVNTIAVLVAQNGRLGFERYADGYRRPQPQLGWSMTKTITSLVAGLMATDERITLDGPVNLPHWFGTAKAAITWRHLLTMTPGLAWFEGYEGASDATEMLFSQADQGRWASDRPVAYKPGTVFNYSTGFSNIAMLRLKQLAGDSPQAIYDYYQRRLFLPLGIRQGVIEFDASGTPVGGARGVLRPVDWLRLGQLVADRGQWAGRPLIRPDYVDFMLAPSAVTSEYGGGLWRQPSPSLPADLRARLPADTVWFGGHMGQYLVVVPSRRLVVLRMGVAFDNATARRQVFSLAADLLAATPPAAAPAASALSSSSSSSAASASSAAASAPSAPGAASAPSAPAAPAAPAATGSGPAAASGVEPLPATGAGHRVNGGGGPAAGVAPAGRAAAPATARP